MQDLIYSDVNRDTADALLANGCTVVTPPTQGCCGSLHAHNGEYELAKAYARRLLDHFDLDNLDAIITNAAGCGSHLKHFDRLLHDDPRYAAKAAQWSEKVKDISEWLVEIDFFARRKNRRRTSQAAVQLVALALRATPPRQRRLPQKPASLITMPAIFATDRKSRPNRANSWQKFPG